MLSKKQKKMSHQIYVYIQHINKKIGVGRPHSSNTEVFLTLLQSKVIISLNNWNGSVYRLLCVMVLIEL